MFLDVLGGGKALFLNANREVYSADIALASAYIVTRGPWLSLRKNLLNKSCKG